MNGSKSELSGKGAREPGLAKTSQKHLKVGWWCLLVFLTLGLVLEALHGFKSGLYLNVSNHTRRLMWTLAHAHGTLLAIVNIVFGATLPLVPSWDSKSRNLASAAMVGATLLLPAGFFLGGVFIYSGDPGLGILLVPIGAILLFLAVFLTARAFHRDPLTVLQPQPPANPSDPAKLKAPGKAKGG